MMMIATMIILFVHTLEVEGERHDWHNGDYRKNALQNEAFSMFPYKKTQGSEYAMQSLRQLLSLINQLGILIIWLETVVVQIR